jgi:hypothetical protein
VDLLVGLPVGALTAYEPTTALASGQLQCPFRAGRQARVWTIRGLIHSRLSVSASSGAFGPVPLLCLACSEGFVPLEVGKMEETQLVAKCPGCSSTDAPKLIVRGSSSLSPSSVRASVHLRCRHCGCEWSDLPQELWAS